MANIRFEGDRVVAPPPATAAEKLADASFLVGCLRNIEHVVSSTADQAVFKVKTGFSFLSTTLDITLRVLERSASAAKFEAVSKGVGAASRVVADLAFRPHESGTSVHYVAEVVERSGFLKLVSAGLIQAAAKTVIDDTWRDIEAKLAAS